MIYANQERALEYGANMEFRMFGNAIEILCERRGKECFKASNTSGLASEALPHLGLSSASQGIYGGHNNALDTVRSLHHDVRGFASSVSLGRNLVRKRRMNVTFEVFRSLLQRSTGCDEGTLRGKEPKPKPKPNPDDPTYGN